MLNMKSQGWLLPSSLSKEALQRSNGFYWIANHSGGGSFVFHTAPRLLNSNSKHKDKGIWLLSQLLYGFLIQAGNSSVDSNFCERPKQLELSL